MPIIKAHGWCQVDVKFWPTNQVEPILEFMEAVNRTIRNYNTIFNYRTGIHKTVNLG